MSRFEPSVAEARIQPAGGRRRKNLTLLPGTITPVPWERDGSLLHGVTLARVWRHKGN